MCVYDGCIFATAKREDLILIDEETQWRMCFNSWHYIYNSLFVGGKIGLHVIWELLFQLLINFGFLNDDNVLAVGLTADAEVGDYAVVEVGIEGLDTDLNAETSDKTYIRRGTSSLKSSQQRTNLHHQHGRQYF